LGGKEGKSQEGVFSTPKKVFVMKILGERSKRNGSIYLKTALPAERNPPQLASSSKKGQETEGRGKELHS